MSFLNRLSTFFIQFSRHRLSGPIAASILSGLLATLVIFYPTWKGTWIFSITVFVFALSIYFHPVNRYIRRSSVLIGLAATSAAIPSINASFKIVDVGDGSLILDNAPIVTIAFIIAACVFGILDFKARANHSKKVWKARTVSDVDPESQSSIEVESIEYDYSITDSMGHGSIGKTRQTIEHGSGFQGGVHIHQYNREASDSETSRSTDEVRIPRLMHPSPILSDWIGRKNELNGLNDWIGEIHSPSIYFIEGIPGIGKTSLSSFWLIREVIPKQEDLQITGIFQWSFAEDGNLDAFLRYLCDYQSIQPGKEDLIAALQQSLFKDRLLLVMDSFERLLWAYSSYNSGEEIEDSIAHRTCMDPLASRFLYMLAVTRNTRALILSRLRPAELYEVENCRPKILNGLDPDNAITYLRKKGIKGHNLELKSACEHFGFHPMSLAQLSNSLRYDVSSPNDISAFHHRTTFGKLKITERCNDILDEALNTLSSDEKEFLIRLSANRQIIPLKLIRFLASGISNETIGTWLGHLEDYHFLNWKRNSESSTVLLNPIVRRYTYSLLEDKKTIHRQIREYYEGFIPKKEIRTAEEFDATVECFHHTARSGDTDSAGFLFFDKLDHLMSIRFGMISRIIDLLIELFPSREATRPSISDPRLQLKVVTQLAYAFRLAGRSDEVFKLFDSSIEISMEHGFAQEIAFGLRNILRQHLLLGNLSKAQEVQNRHKSLAVKNDSKLLLGLSHRDLGLIYSIQGEYKEANKEFDKAHCLFEEEGDRRRLGVVWAYRSRMARWMGDPDASLQAALRSRELSRIEERERDVIWAEWQLGAAYRMLGEYDKAKQHIYNALKGSRETSMVDLEVEILLELGRILLGSHLAEPLPYIDEALMIASRYKYRFAEADGHLLRAQIFAHSDNPSLARNHLRIAEEKAEAVDSVYKPTRDEIQRLYTILR